MDLTKKVLIPSPSDSERRSHSAIILSQMASVLQIATEDAVRRIQRVQTVTIAWMSVEAVVSLFAAWRARSPALLAFGGDSTIELLSAVVVLWRFRASAAHEEVERRATRVAGALLFVLAACVAILSVMSLLGYCRTPTNISGNRHSDRRRSCHAVACERETPSVRSYRQCCVESGRCTVGGLCLPFAGRLGGTGDQRDLARKVGRPDCGFGGSAAHCLGGPRSHAREGLRLLLGSPPLGPQAARNAEREGKDVHTPTPS